MVTPPGAVEPEPGQRPLERRHQPLLRERRRRSRGARKKAGRSERRSRSNPRPSCRRSSRLDVRRVRVARSPRGSASACSASAPQVDPAELLGHRQRCSTSRARARAPRERSSSSRRSGFSSRSVTSRRAASSSRAALGVGLVRLHGHGLRGSRGRRTSIRAVASSRATSAASPLVAWPEQPLDRESHQLARGTRLAQALHRLALEQIARGGRRSPRSRTRPCGRRSAGSTRGRAPARNSSASAR